MTETAQKIYNHLKQNPQYNYSQDLSISRIEKSAVDELVQNGYIRIKAHALGFVIADVF